MIGDEAVIRIISKRSSYLERSITFEVNGRIETVSAPASTTTFDDLIARIETEFGAASKEAEATGKVAESPDQTEPEKTPRRRKKTVVSDESAE